MSDESCKSESAIPSVDFTHTEIVAFLPGEKTAFRTVRGKIPASRPPASLHLLSEHQYRPLGRAKPHNAAAGSADSRAIALSGISASPLVNGLTRNVIASRRRPERLLVRGSRAAPTPIGRRSRRRCALPSSCSVSGTPGLGRLSYRKHIRVFDQPNEDRFDRNSFCGTESRGSDEL